MASKVLYEDGQLKVEVSREEERCSLWIGDTSYIFSRDAMIELAKTSRGDLASRLDGINPLILINAGEKGLTPDAVGMALSQARVIEIEKWYGIRR